MELQRATVLFDGVEHEVELDWPVECQDSHRRGLGIWTVQGRFLGDPPFAPGATFRLATPVVNGSFYMLGEPAGSFQNDGPFYLKGWSR